MDKGSRMSRWRAGEKGRKRVCTNKRHGKTVVDDSCRRECKKGAGVTYANYSVTAGCGSDPDFMCFVVIPKCGRPRFRAGPVKSPAAYEEARRRSRRGNGADESITMQGGMIHQFKRTTSHLHPHFHPHGFRKRLHWRNIGV